MGNRSGAPLSHYQLRQLSAASGLGLPRLYEIYGAYRYYAKPFNGLGRHGYMKMYRHYNPQYAAYAPEMADRAFFAFDRDRDGNLNFYEFLTSVLLAEGSPQNAMQVAQVYAPPVRVGWVTYPESSRYTNFLYRYLAPPVKTLPSYYTQQIWNKLAPKSYTSYVPQYNYYQAIRNDSIFTPYFQQSYQNWPQYQVPYYLQDLAPIEVYEEIYPMQTYQQLPIVNVPVTGQIISDEIYQLPTYNMQTTCPHGYLWLSKMPLTQPRAYPVPPPVCVDP